MAAGSAGAVAWAGGARPAFAQEKKRPNIIFLLTDDQRWDSLGCMGNKIIQTPNIDAMAAAGALFENCYVTTSICCCSRASIFSGQYVNRNGIGDFATPFSAEAQAQTYPMLLRAAGYRTGFIGKYGVGNAQSMPKEGFDYWRGIPGQPIYEQKDKDGNYKHLTKIMEEQSVEFLEGCSADQPFCLSVSFKAPHVQDGDPRQFIYDRAYKDMFKDVTIPESETGAPEYFDRMPDFLKDEKTEARRRWRIRFETPEKYQESVKGYYRLLYGVDVAVGRIRETLKARGLDDNTVIVYTGDNGFFLGEHGWAGKWYGHNESVRVPLVVYDPRRPKTQQGQRRDEIALNIDIAPTILSLAGVPTPAGMQGRNLAPALDGSARQWRSDFYYEHPFGAGGRIPETEGVISLKWKYLKYYTQEPVYEELYDLEKDPYEKENLASKPEYADVLKRMRQRYATLKRETR